MPPLLSLLAIALFAAAAVTDLRSRRIPNQISLVLAGLALVRIGMALAAGVGWSAAGLDLVAAVAVFALGACAFRLAILGGGDVKLIAAGALWFGLAGLAPFLLTTVLAGGLLAMLFVGRQMAVPRGGAGPKGPDLPYAVAIAAGGILTTLLWT